MLAKRYRLTGKDVNYLVKKGAKRYGNTFGFFWIKQYANRPYHQFSVQIGLQVHKRSTKRNIIKRQVLEGITKQFATTQIGGSYRKVFCMIHKNAAGQIHNLIESTTKKSIKEEIAMNFQKDLLDFQQRVSGIFSNR